MNPREANNPAAQTAERSTHGSVLVVDDELNFVILLDRVLSKRGYRVITAANAEEALALVDKRMALDVAIIDIRMGPMDGMALLAELKHELPELKVIMLTAYPTYEARVTSIKNGASAYFTKPVELKSLLDTVAACQRA
jgi:DNA-binding NtrC family response regulator